MRKYMVVVAANEDGEQHAKFFDHLEQSHSYWMDATVSVGVYAELYEYGRLDPDDEMEPFSYVQIM